MALINSASFGALSEVSVTSGQAKKPGKFFNVFVTGQSRPGQIVDRYQCMAGNIDSTSEYFIHNAAEVFFIPLYIKRYWAKYARAQAANGDQYDKLVDFGWKDNVPKKDGECKYEYIIAGYLWDVDNNNIKRHSADMPDHEIKAGDPIMIYFKCKGTRCTCAYEYINRANEYVQTNKLEALSDNPAFEQQVINPRRFLVKAGTKYQQIQKRSVVIFDFIPERALPNDLVVKIIDQSNKMLDDFEYQFDKTDSIQNEASAGDTSTYQPTESDLPEMAPVSNVVNVDDIQLDF